MSERRALRGGAVVGSRVAVRSRAAGVAGLAVVLAIAAGACGPAPTAPATATPAPTPAVPTPALPPPATILAGVPEAGILLPVPDAWRTIGAADLADPAVRADLAATYPGTAELLGAVAELDGWAEPVFLAVDPAAAGAGAGLTANLSVLVSQPSVGGPLLDIAAGFICDALRDILPAAEERPRERARPAIGEAVRCAFDLPPAAGEPLVAEAWVIGAPAGTILVTLLGPAEALGGLTAAGIAEAIVPLPAP